MTLELMSVFFLVLSCSGEACEATESTEAVVIEAIDTTEAVVIEGF
jgi:hypothetical protein